jgi:hypothetical protein
MKRFVLYILTLLLALASNAQDIGQIGKTKALTVSGGVGLSMSSISASDSNRIPMPFYWNFNTQLNFSLYGLNIPLSVIVTNGKINLTNSFSQFGISPYYKWAKLHAGYRQMQFSPYSLNDQTFLGAGIELTPGKFRFAAMYGSFRKATPLDTSGFVQQIPGSYPLDVTSVNGQNRYSQQGSYSRTGFGFKIGVGKPNNFVDLIFFKGKDNIQSVKDTFTQNRLQAEENVVVGINSMKRFGKHINFGFNGAVSVYTYNTTADTIPLDDKVPYQNIIKGIMPITATTQLQWAGDVSLGFNFKNFTLQTQYKRIEPYFRSMGIVSFLSDLQSISIAPSWSMFKQKVRFNNTLQLQNDNLNGYKQYTTDRTIINSNVSINPSNYFGFDINYSGFTMMQTKKKAASPDSIKTGQTSNSYMLIPHLVFTGKKATDVISVVTSYTTVNGGGILKKDSSKIDNYYATLNNSLSFNKSGLSITTGANYNSAKTIFNTLESIGATLGFAKGFFKNTFTVSNTNTLLFNTLNGKTNGNTYSIDLLLNYQLARKHNFTVTGNYLYSPANGIYTLYDFKQTRIDASYQYNF